MMPPMTIQFICVAGGDGGIGGDDDDDTGTDGDDLITKGMERLSTLAVYIPGLSLVIVKVTCSLAPLVRVTSFVSTATLSILSTAL